MKNSNKAAIIAGISFLGLTSFTIALRPSPLKTVINKNTAADTANSIYDAGIAPQLISKQFSFTEGASVDKKGNVFFTDQPNNKIWEYDTNGKLSVFLDNAGRSNGTYFDKKGNLVTCADEKDELWSISPNKAITVLLKDYQGHLFNGPNDLWIDAKGGIYLSDPYYHRDYWTRNKPDLEAERVYYLPKNSKTPVIVVGDLKKPNGIVGTPDGKHLYVADIGANKTYEYAISKDGSLTDKKLFVEQGSDGMTLDNRGDVYLTGKEGVYVYNPNGQRIALIPIPEPWTANLCFSGKNKDVLFITASKAIYTIQTKVKGIE